MRVLFLKYWEYIAASFWFLPSLMAAGAIGLGQLLVTLDHAARDQWLSGMSWIYGGGAEGASAVLQTIAGSMITIAGVVFSLTLVALSLTSSQFGPRLLRNFMRDRSNQVVLGTFIATFLYCLIVLRTIRNEEYGSFVPHLSITFAVAFALASLWVLIYFIHHVSVSIQADEVIARVAAELQEVMDRMFPEETGASESERGPARDQGWEQRALAALQDGQAEQGCRILAPQDGYLQIIDLDTLMELACEHGMALLLERRPGHYIVRGTPLLTAWPRESMTPEVEEKMQAAFLLGTQRTQVQDVEFAVLQLVEIAVRALSPGVNDPFTAITCIDRLSSALYRLARRDLPEARRYSQDGRLRISATVADFPGIADAAFNQLRQYALGNADVTIRLLEAIATVAQAAGRQADFSALQKHADMIAAGAERELQEPNDRQAVQQRYRAVKHALAQRQAACAGAGGMSRLPAA